MVFIEVLKAVAELCLHRIQGHWNPKAPILHLDVPKTFSIGLRSGVYGGKCRYSTPFSRKKPGTSLAVRIRALSITSVTSPGRRTSEKPHQCFHVRQELFGIEGAVAECEVLDPDSTNDHQQSRVRLSVGPDLLGVRSSFWNPGSERAVLKLNPLSTMNQSCSSRIHLSMTSSLKRFSTISGENNGIPQRHLFVQ